MNINAVIAEVFRSAIENPENIKEDGSVNWDFVEADVLIGVGIDNVIENMGMSMFFEYFNLLVDVRTQSEVA